MSKEIEVRSLETGLPVLGCKVFVRSGNNWSELKVLENGYSLFIDDSAESMKVEAPLYNMVHVAVSELGDKIWLIPQKNRGYLNKIDAHPNEKLGLHANLINDCRIQLFRHGQNLELIHDFGICEKYSQNALLVKDPVQEGFGWLKNMDLMLPPNLKAGLYSVRLIDQKTDELYQAIPLVINTNAINSTEKKKILVVASNTTWQSYNLYGGRSRYRNNQEKSGTQFKKVSIVRKYVAKSLGLILPNNIKRTIVSAKFIKEQPLEWKFRKLSIQRPFTHCGLEDDDPNYKFMNHLAGGEWRLLAWLEKKGIHYDYCSTTELHFNKTILDGYKGVVFSTHCEYWSKEMYGRLKEYHMNNKLWIINISGNTMYREIEFFDDRSTKCVSLSFKDSVADETVLTGGRFDPLDYGTAAAYRVSKSDHWVFDNTGLSQKDTFGHLSLNTNVPVKGDDYHPGRIGRKQGLDGTGASGWECDKRVDGSKKNFILLAKGENAKGGSEMVIKEPEGNRGGVFSVGSILFGGALLIDDKISVLVENVFKKVMK